MQYQNNLKHYRLKHNLTQQQVAELLGHKSVSRLSAWEQGTSMPSIDNLFQLCWIYKVNAEMLYKPKKEKIPPKLPVPESSQEPIPEKTRIALEEVIKPIMNTTIYHSYKDAGYELLVPHLKDNGMEDFYERFFGSETTDSR